jgi:hypothetical protein
MTDITTLEWAIRAKDKQILELADALDQANAMRIEWFGNAQIHMYYGILGSASRDEGRSWAAKQAAIHRANRIPLAEAWISEV